MKAHDKQNKVKLTGEDQSRMLRLTEEIKSRQIEMSFIASRYLKPRAGSERGAEPGHGIPIQDVYGTNVGCYDAESGECYPIPAGGVC
jgi:hypothetical protein